MRLEHIDKSMVETLYRERMVIDFPEDELKPLGVILAAIDQGIYESLGLFDEETLIGYCFLVRLNNDYLVDYLAIHPERRNSGAGSVMVRLLAEYLRDADNVIGEVEDPGFAEDEEQKNIQSRRLSFYIRNGCTDTGLRVTTFGVPFIVLRIGEGNCSDPDSLRELYQSFYREILPEDIFEKCVLRSQKYE